MLFAVSKAPLLCVLGALLLSLQTAAQGPGELQPILPSQPQQCSNITLSWSETATTDDTQYYAVRIIDSHTAGLYLASEVPITLVGTFNGTTSYSWCVNVLYFTTACFVLTWGRCRCHKSSRRVGIPVGTNITLLVTDHNGNRGCVLCWSFFRG